MVHQMEKADSKPHPPRFVIPAEDAALLAAQHGVSLPDLLPVLVPPAMSLPRPPISKFPVAAVGLGVSGRIFVGVNLEFPGVPLHHSVHAEQFLFSSAASHAEPRISHVAVSHVPCGHCRQFLQEVRGSGAGQGLSVPPLQILVTSDPDPAYRPLGDILPHPFGPSDLLHDDAPLLLEHPNHSIVLEPDGHPAAAAGAICNGDAPPEAALESRLRGAALDAARRCHAPYSGCPAGFAVADAQGRVYAGAYAESAAYNPSLGPVQAALIAYVGGGGGHFTDISAAALVERGPGALVAHADTAALLLRAVAPGCAPLRVYHCRQEA